MFFEKYRRKDCKKGEVTSQMFMYIMAAIIAGIILVIGANAIIKLTNSQKTASDTLFRTNVISFFDTTQALSFGSERIKDFSVLSDFSTICFLSKDSILSNVADTPYTEINNAVSSDVEENVYLVSSKSLFSFKVADISSFSSSLTLGLCASKNCYCHDIISGKIKLRLKAKGDSIEVVNIQ